MMQIARDSSAQDFLSKARRFLYENEPTNSLLLGLSEGFLASPPKPPPFFLRVVQNRQTVLAALQTPPMSLLLTDGPKAAVEKLAETLHLAKVSIPGVVGPIATADFFAQSWSTLTGKKSRLAVKLKMYKLEKVLMPELVPGEIRVASNQDVAALLGWTKDFAREALAASDQRTESQWREMVEKDVLGKKAFLWVIGGQPVSMASLRRPTKNGASISSVYTPLEHRRRGYASALVAHLSQRLLSEGKRFCVLYADLSNTTSNKIYQNIGYREDSDSSHYLFE